MTCPSRRVSLFFAIVLVCSCFGLSSGMVVAQKGERPAKQFEEFDPNNFENSTKIDNKWFPLKPGTQYVFKGQTQEEKKRVPHRVVFIVTDLAKIINGVRALVVWEMDYKAGKMVEQELVFFAQDNDGNVWHLGQLSETYDDQEFVGARAFLVGTDGARAGIMVQAN